MIFKHPKSTFAFLLALLVFAPMLAFAQQLEFNCAPGEYLNGVCVTQQMKDSSCNVTTGGTGTVQPWEVCDPDYPEYRLCDANGATGIMTLGCNVPTATEFGCTQYVPGACISISSLFPTFTEVDPKIGILATDKVCTSDGALVNCSSDFPTFIEEDPKIGTLGIAGKVCTTDGAGIVNCNSDFPTFTEADPKIGDIANIGKFCTTSGTQVICNSDIPVPAQVWQPTASPADAGVYFDGGNVGIGTTAPGYLLDTRNSSATGAVIANLSNDNATSLWTGLRLARGAAPAEKWFVGMDSTTDNLLFRRGGSTNDVVIDPYGNVGIGTTNPQAILDVKGIIRSVYDSNFDVVLQGSGTGILNTPGTTDRQMALVGTTPATTTGYQDTLFVNYQSDYAGGTIIGGPVGIGTNPSASQTFEVSGNSKITGSLALTGSLIINDTVYNSGTTVTAPHIHGVASATAAPDLAKWLSVSVNGASYYIPLYTAQLSTGTVLVNGVHTDAECTSAGGTVSGTMCKFTAASCPAGWNQYLNWSATSVASGVDTIDWYEAYESSPAGPCAYEPTNRCTTSSHTFANQLPESCTYTDIDLYFDSTAGQDACDLPYTVTVTANIVTIGCY